MNENPSNPLNRFSNRVNDYVKSRPSYPAEIMKFIVNDLGLEQSDKIADIGSGTGKFSELLLKNKNVVYCVEPNNEMRKAAEKLLSGYRNFISINGEAENTGLDNNCVKFVTCAQAFHWFNHEKVKAEFLRILIPDGWVILIWNSRIIDSTNFMKDYEELLLNFSIDYSQVNHKNIDERILDRFFRNYKLKIFPYSQSFDFEGLKSRLLSSSYAPKEDHPKYRGMLDALENIFNKNNVGGNVEFIYNSEVYFGKI